MNPILAPWGHGVIWVGKDLWRPLAKSPAGGQSCMTLLRDSSSHSGQCLSTGRWGCFASHLIAISVWQLVYIALCVVLCTSKETLAPFSHNHLCTREVTSAPCVTVFIIYLPELEVFDLSYLGYLGMEVFVPQVLKWGFWPVADHLYKLAHRESVLETFLQRTRGWSPRSRLKSWRRDRTATGLLSCH